MTAPGEPLPVSPGAPVPSGPLVVTGSRLGWLVPTLAAALGAALLALGSVLALGQLHLPWMLPASLVANPLVAPIVVVFAAAFAAALVRPTFLARSGRVELGAERIVFRRRGLLHRSVAWSELEAYTDASSASVGLLRRGERASRARFAIPTRTEETRVRVLHLLDERGLRRVEVAARGRRLAWALVAGALAVLAFLVALHAVNARARRALAIWASAKASDEDKAFLARTVHVRQRLRPAVGTEDALYIEGRVDFDKPARFLDSGREYFGIQIRERLEVDGAALATQSDQDGYTLGGWGGVETNALPFRVRHRLPPGRHEVRIVTRVALGETRVEEETRATLEVAPGSVAASAVALVHGATPPLSLLDPTRLTGEGGDVQLLMFCPWLDHAMAFEVEVLDGATSIERGVLIEPAGRGGLCGVATTDTKWDLVLRRLGVGHHALTLRFTPSTKLAFENDATCTEIYGEPFEKDLVLDVK